MHRCAHAAALIRKSEHSALEFNREAWRGFKIGLELILLGRASRIVGKTGKLGEAIGKRRKERVSRRQIFPRERRPFVGPSARRIGPHIFDRRAQRIDVCFRDAERNELTVTVFETSGGAEVIGVAHGDRINGLRGGEVRRQKSAWRFVATCQLGAKG